MVYPLPKQGMRTRMQGLLGGASYINAPGANAGKKTPKVKVGTIESQTEKIEFCADQSSFNSTKRAKLNPSNVNVGMRA